MSERQEMTSAEICDADALPYAPRATKAGLCRRRVLLAAVAGALAGPGWVSVSLTMDVSAGIPFVVVPIAVGIRLALGERGDRWGSYCGIFGLSGAVAFALWGILSYVGNPSDAMALLSLTMHACLSIVAGVALTFFAGAAARITRAVRNRARGSAGE